VSTIDSGHLEGRYGGQKGSEEAVLVGRGKGFDLWPNMCAGHFYGASCPALSEPSILLAMPKSGMYRLDKAETHKRANFLKCQFEGYTMAYLLARVENFARFEGENLSAKPVMGYGKSGEVPHEMYNFTVASDGLIYGYLPKEGGGNLQRLGGERSAEKVSNVTVLFISSGVLCGYYRNATVLAAPVRHPDRLKAGGSEIYCRVNVDPKNAFLIPVERRIEEVRPRPQGQFPVLYGDAKSDWVNWFEELIQETNAPVASEKKRRRWTERVERSSKARRMAIKHFGHKCECCQVSHDDSVRAAMFEVHHKVPYADNFETRELKASDLAVLCANCHRMIHKMPDVAEVEGLRGYLGLD
jgi:5-methylcytosine-specific restriction protein A